MSKGKQPKTRVNKVPKLLLSEIKEVVIEYYQVIGLEAAIFLRSRKRALVQWIIHRYYLYYNSIEDKTDLNNIPRPCPYIFYMG